MALLRYCIVRKRNVKSGTLCVVVHARAAPTLGRALISIGEWRRTDDKATFSPGNCEAHTPQGATELIPIFASGYSLSGCFVADCRLVSWTTPLAPNFMQECRPCLDGHWIHARFGGVPLIGGRDFRIRKPFLRSRGSG